LGGVKGYSHCFGYYKNFKFATQAVHNNYGDINETIYDYVVIEYIEEGLNPICKKRWFYKFDYENHKYEFIPEPEAFKNICNIGLG